MGSAVVYAIYTIHRRHDIYGPDAEQFRPERWISDGVYGNQYVVCAPGTCPRSTTDNPTIDFNRMKGAFYFDIGATVNVTRQVSMFVKVDNVFDHDPEPSPQTNTGLDVNPALYDTLGRFFRVGVRGRL